MAKKIEIQEKTRLTMQLKCLCFAKYDTFSTLLKLDKTLNEQQRKVTKFSNQVKNT